MNIPLRYLPKILSKKDKLKQIKMLNKSKKLYKMKSPKYYSREKLSSYKSKTSKHIKNAQRIYNINKITPSLELAKKTSCSINALKKIVNKGRGAYFSSGSRPNQSAESWGLARLAASITGAKAAAVDFDIINKNCNHSKSIAYKMAVKSRKINGYGHSKTKHVHKLL
jgi:hypothetical protein